jgi:hypothetical protein
MSYFPLSIIDTKISNGNSSNVTGTVLVANGGTSKVELLGLMYGNGTSPVSTASSTQIASAIGSTFVANSVNSNSATNVAASGILGNTLPVNVTASSLTSVGTLTNLVVSGTVALGPVAGLSTSSVVVTTLSPTVIDTFQIATYRSAKYIVQISDSGNYEIAEILVIHDGSLVSIAIYGNVCTSTAPLGSFDANIASGTLSILFTASAVSSKTVKLTRTAISV